MFMDIMAQGFCHSSVGVAGTRLNTKQSNSGGLQKWEVDIGKVTLR